MSGEEESLEEELSVGREMSARICSSEERQKMEEGK